MSPVAKFLVPAWGDLVDSGIGLLYRPARHRIAGRNDNPMQEWSTYITQSGPKNLATGEEESHSAISLKGQVCLSLQGAKGALFLRYSTLIIFSYSSLLGFTRDGIF